MRLLTALLFAVSMPAAAQTDWLPIPEDVPRRIDRGPAVGEWHLAADIGWANYIPGVFRERGTRFVVYGERQVHRWLAVQADVNCSRGTKRATAFTPQEFLSMCAGVVGGVVPIRIHPKVWPYLRAGYGVALWDEQAREGFYDVDDTSPTVVIGGGFRSYLGAQQRVGLRVDVQRQETSLRELRVPHWSFGFGVSVRIPRGARLED